MKKITVSAPGKLVLFGEHAVVYGRPCIVTAMDQRMQVSIETTLEPEIMLDAPDVNILHYKKPLSQLGTGDMPKGAQFVEMAVKNILCHPELVSGSSQKNQQMLKQVQHDKVGLRIETKSEFSAKLGFGSSSAATVCVVKALSELFHLQFSQKEIFDISYKTVMDIQKKGSGVDIAASVYGGTLYFVTGGKIIEELSTPELPLIVGYSGIKADTVTLLNQVKEKFSSNKKQLDEIYNEIGKIVEEAKQALVEKNYSLLGQLMNANQHLLKELGVSIEKLDHMIQGVRDAGALGAKLSGAGGGDCMLALHSAQDTLQIEEAIRDAGGEVIHVASGAEGVRVE